MRSESKIEKLICLHEGILTGTNLAIKLFSVPYRAFPDRKSKCNLA